MAAFGTITTSTGLVGRFKRKMARAMRFSLFRTTAPPSFFDAASPRRGPPVGVCSVMTVINRP